MKAEWDAPARQVVDLRFARGAGIIAPNLGPLVNRLAALFLLVILSPLMALTALFIWCTDGAPILYGHYRVGLNGKLFRCLKFRTMALNSRQLLDELVANDPAAAETWRRDQKLTHDPRVTAIGALLRTTSTDELPQLINVVRGDMLLVGPRPITAPELVRYGRTRWFYPSVRPGITGLWQVSGRNELSYGERVALDKRYIEQRTWLTDLWILVLTLRVVLLRKGAR